MATYLQGVEPFIPDYQPFQPNLNFYAKALQTKQNQYDTNWKQLNDIYSKYFNADVLRPSDIEKKDHLLKQIDFELRRVSGLDLSLEQNLQQATQVFRPFYEDKVLMHDMAYTKNYKNKRAAAMSLKNNPDEKKAEQYWNEGIEFMDINKDYFVNSSDEESMTMWAPEYTPWINARKLYDKIADDLGIEKDITVPEGNWMVRRRNGSLIYEPLVNVFKAEYANNPGLQEVYRVQAFVNRERSIKQEMQKGMDRVAAETKYLNDQDKLIQEYITQMSKVAKEDLDNKNANLDKAKKKIEAKEDNMFTKQYVNNLEQSKAYAQSVWTSVFNAKKETSSKPESTVVTTQGDISGDVMTRRRKIDAGTAMMLANQDIYEAAARNAGRDELIEYEANPFKLLELKNQYKLAQISAKEAADKRVNREDYMLRNKMWILGDDMQPKPNPKFTYADKIVDQSFTSKEQATIVEINRRQVDRAFKTYAEPGINAGIEFLAKQADAGNLTKGELLAITMSDTDIQKKLKAGGFTVKDIQQFQQGEGTGVLSDQAQAVLQSFSPEKVTGDEVRKILGGYDWKALGQTRHGKRLLNFYQKTMSLANSHRGDMGSADNYIKYMKEANEGGLIGYIELMSRNWVINQYNYDLIQEDLKGSLELDKLVKSVGGGDDLKRIIAGSFINIDDMEPLSQEGFYDLVREAVLGEEGVKNDKGKLELEIYHNFDLDVYGIGADPNTNYYRRGPGVDGAPRREQSRSLRFGNFNDHDWHNVDKIVNGTINHFIDDYLNNGFLQYQDPSEGKRTLELGQGKVPDVAIASYRQYVARQYATAVNKLVRLSDPNTLDGDRLYKNFSKIYKKKAQSKDLKSYIPLTMDKLNALGVNDVIGHNVNLAAAMGEGVELFMDAKQNIDRDDFTNNFVWNSDTKVSDATSSNFGMVALGIPLTKSGIMQNKMEDAPGVLTGDMVSTNQLKIDAARAKRILDDIESEIGSGYKGAEGDGLEEIKIGAITRNVLEDESLGAVVISGIPFKWLYDNYVKVAGEKDDLGVLTPSEAIGIATHGISFVRPWQHLKNYQIVKDAEVDPLEMAMSAMGYVDYVDYQTNAGAFKFSESANPKAGSPHTITGFVQALDENGNWYKADISNMMPDQKYNLTPIFQSFVQFITEQNRINEEQAKAFKKKGIDVGAPPDIPFDYYIP